MMDKRTCDIPLAYGILGLRVPGELPGQYELDFAERLLKFCPRQRFPWFTQDDTMWLARQLAAIYRVPRENIPSVVIQDVISTDAWRAA